MDYKAYLLTAHWQDVRVRALRNAENRCQLCYSPIKLQIHHRTYKRLGQERDSDVLVLCDDCHSRHHRKKPSSEQTNDLKKIATIRQAVDSLQQIMDDIRGAADEDRIEAYNQLWRWQDYYREEIADIRKLFLETENDLDFWTDTAMESMSL